MRFVAVKSEAAQASAAIFRTRDLLVRQRTQLITAIRGQLYRIRARSSERASESAKASGTRW
ncbi:MULTISPECIES: hypothetical protein [unclassified Acidisoma]|uniref:hypothetical protein n=1 Tax=unclassified Acidisoma TaxID=2634065 RepID=UPI0020B12779|nr:MULTISPECIES: hypothetical protein [unclassified Acidisoma]